MTETGVRSQEGVVVLGDDVVQVRPLSDGERAELARLGRWGAVFRGWWYVLVLFPIAMLATLIRHEQVVHVWVMFAIAFFASRGWTLPAVIYQRFTLRADRKVGEVLVVRSPRRQLEFLPVSRSLWTSAGREAPWRREDP